MKILAAILARGGSKGLPGKNIANLAGKPLISYSIQAAQGVKAVSDIVVSSDDQTILDVAESYRAKALIRPKALAADNATSEEALHHLVSHMLGLGKKYDYVLLLQPTSPLRTTQHINEAIAQLSPQTKSLVSICLSSKNPYLFKKIDDEGYLQAIFEIPKNEHYPLARQNNEAYYLNGAIYLVQLGHFLKTKSLYCDRMRYYLMDRKASLDIDTQLDLDIANYLLTKE